MSLNCLIYLIDNYLFIKRYERFSETNQSKKKKNKTKWFNIKYTFTH